MLIQLAYSFHLGSDKNKKNSSRNSAKSNVSGTTSKSNNAIQNSAGLTKCCNHNYRNMMTESMILKLLEVVSLL